jgi:hypothetical protein
VAQSRKLQILFSELTATPKYLKYAFQLSGIHAKGQYEREILIDRFLPASHPQGSLNGFVNI